MPLKNQTKPYRFISDKEPSDEELAALMHEVAIEAKNKAKKAELKLKIKIKLQV